MKYSFNEKDLFDLFIDKDNDFRPVLKEPYLKDGYVHAADGYKLIRIKADTLYGEYTPTEKMKLRWPDENCDYLITAKEIEKAIASIPQVKEEIEIGRNIKCPECNGDGTVFWEYTDKNLKTHEVEFDCPICGGDGYLERTYLKKTGRMIPDRTASIGFGTSNLRVDKVEVLFKAMKIIGVEEVRLVAQIENKNIFKIDENISVFIMGYLREADYIIKLR